MTIDSYDSSKSVNVLNVGILTSVGSGDCIPGGEGGWGGTHFVNYIGMCESSTVYEPLWSEIRYGF